MRFVQYYGLNEVVSCDKMQSSQERYYVKEKDMEKYIPYEKMSKKQRKELNNLKRRTWGEISPVTRRPENPKAYNRKKARKWSDDSPCSVPF